MSEGYRVNELTREEISITVGSEWQHYKKFTKYKVLHLANIHGDRWPWMVVYIDEQAQVWARPVDEWVGRYEELVKGSGDF